MESELIADYQCVTGENPLWHPLEQRLYWLDIPTGRMFRYDPATGQHEQFYQGEVVGGFTIQPDGALLLFMRQGAIKVWRNGQLTTIHADIPGERASRFNDVIADPVGRVFGGTMSTPERLGRLYRLETDGQLYTVLQDVGTSNGMGFTPDRQGFYHTDSPKHEISLYDYEQATGEISNPRLFVRTPEDEGVPDGMTVDAEGYVWSARWDGSCLVRYTPQGQEALRVYFPAKKVSSVVFGGPDYRDIYVTTAGGDKKDENGWGAGALFRLRANIQGVPEFFSRVRL